MTLPCGGVSSNRPIRSIKITKVSTLWSLVADSCVVKGTKEPLKIEDNGKLGFILN
jgi:hypothetical protein